MQSNPTPQSELDPRTREFYQKAITVLTDSKVPFLVGGAYAFERYTGIARHTKDIDFFAREDDCKRILEAFSKEGYRTEFTFPHWLGKAYLEDQFADMIFSSGNGVSPVDDSWFEHAVESEVLGVSLKLCPVEEMLWSKMFIMERERYDGADVAHLLYACAKQINWSHLLERFDPYWRLLLSHLILFGFIYPTEQNLIPAEVMQELLGRLQNELQQTPSTEKVCQGTLLSRQQYLPDLKRGYHDARLQPRGNMTAEQLEVWTAAIWEQK